MLQPRFRLRNNRREHIHSSKWSSRHFPSTNSAIPHGVTRHKIIEISENLRYAVSERRITPFELINAEEVFLVMTLVEILPVVKVNGRLIDLEGRTSHWENLFRIRKGKKYAIGRSGNIREACAKIATNHGGK